MSYTTASLFSGGGLWDVGAKMAGFVPVWGVEIRPDIAAVAERNIPDFYVVRADVATVDYSALPRVDHLHASTSCKEASPANSEGKEQPEDMASALSVCRAIRQVRPETFTLENVWQYRNFLSFKLILAYLGELGYHFDYWHLNSADYGVPQTRKRLILIARLDRKPAKPQATHYKPDAKKAVMGMRSMFWEPWRGWYQAIEDLIPTLPDSEFAPWQMERLPVELKSMLLAQGGFDGQIVNRDLDEPAFTVTSNSNQAGVRAYLAPVNGEYSTGFEETDPAPTVTTQFEGRAKARLLPGGGNTNFAEAKPGKGVRGEDEPAQTVTTVTQAGGSMPRAFLAGDNYGSPNDTGKERILQLYSPDDPAMTVTAQAKRLMKAFVADGQNAGKPDRLTTRQDDEPMFSITDQGKAYSRALRSGRVVRMTPRCLARFQSVPDWYILPEPGTEWANLEPGNGLACEVIGNGVPSLLAQRICESLQ